MGTEEKEPLEAVALPEGTISRSVRWDPADLERVERAAEALSARLRLNVTAADFIRRSALREADAILEPVP